MTKYLLFFLICSCLSIAQESFVIKNINVITMTDDAAVLENVNVVITGDKISSIGDAIPGGVRTIDGSGKWLIPGLIDMHVHVPTDGHFNTTYPTRAAAIFTKTQDVMTPFIANGVTTIFDLNSKAGHFGQRNEILRGDVIGPRMALAANINGGNESDNKMANTPEDGRQSVRIAKAEGYEFIKAYSQLNVETFLAIVDEAGKQGMKVVGHIPNSFRGKTKEAFVPHFDLVAHAEEFAKFSNDFSADSIPRFIDYCKSNGAWLMPTLVVIERSADQAKSLDSVRNLEGFGCVHPLLQNKWITSNNNFKGTSPERVRHLERMTEFNNRLVKEFNKAGIPIVAGTDAGCSGVIWGYSLHNELEFLVKAGLTTGQALSSSTRLAAKWLGIDSLVGTIQDGKLADLVLLDANPLESIVNTRKIAAVIVNGRYVDRFTIDLMLKDLTKRNTEALGKWEWRERSKY